MTHRFLTLSLAGFITAIMLTPLHAGGKRCDSRRSSRHDDSRVIAGLRVVLPWIRVSIHDGDYSHSSHQSWSYRKHDHHQTQTPRVHVCSTTMISRVQPPCHRKFSNAIPRPSRHHVWVAGYWQRQCCGWKWVNGHWKLRPFHNAVYIQGSWVETRHGWRWVAGTWSEPDCY